MNKLEEKEQKAIKEYFQKLGASEVILTAKYGGSKESDDNRYYNIALKSEKSLITLKGLYLGHVELVDFKNKEIQIYLSDKDLQKIRLINQLL